MSNSPRLSGFSDEQSRAIQAELAKLRAELSPQPDRVLDRRKTGTIRPRPGDVVRANAGDTVVLPHPRSAKGRAPVVVLVESQPVVVTSESGTVNDQRRVTVTTLGAMEWFSTGSEWWGTAVGGDTGGGSGSDPPATGSEDGFLSRLVFVNAASAAIGTTFGGVTCEAAVTWTTAADVPDGNVIGFWGTGAGGGGASGHAGNDVGAPGGAGGGGAAAPLELRYPRAEVIAALPVTFTCPLGAAGGAGGSGSPFNGNPGAAGGVASAGGLYTAGGGGGGNAPTAFSAQPGGGGGGALTSGPAGTTAAAGNITGGDPGGSTAAANTGFGGAGASTGASFHAAYGGAAGATAVDLAGTRVTGASSWHGCGGGGAGGAGGVGGPSVDQPTAGGVGGSITAGGGGAVGTSNINANGTDGSPGPTGVALRHGGGGGGGGGASARGIGGAAVTGGAGGAGGFPGGGGGGSGAAVVNSGSTKTALAGGNGGDSVLVVTFYA